jgi:branched-chain amino acid transport system ATP-binding protein
VAASRAGIVLVPDNRSLFTTLTVEENLEVARSRRGPAPRELLDVFPALDKRWRLPAGALSGGEQQMLAMARALIQQPKILLIDEMSMGLAPLVVEALFDTVRRIASDHGAAIVLVEQHVKLALDVADEGAVLNRGTIVLRGSADALRSDAKRLEHAYLGDLEVAR